MTAKVSRKETFPLASHLNQSAGPDSMGPSELLHLSLGECSAVMGPPDPVLTRAKDGVSSTHPDCLSLGEAKPGRGPRVLVQGSGRMEGCETDPTTDVDHRAL